MRIVLLGAGLQAQAAGQDVVAQDDVSELVVADADEGRARALVERLGDARARAREGVEALATAGWAFFDDLYRVVWPS